LIVGAVREQPLLIFNERFLKADLLEVRRVSGRDIDLFHEPFPSSPPRTLHVGTSRSESIVS
jgi:hypothetical protein